MKWFLRIATLLGGLVAVAVVVLLALGQREDANRLRASIDIAKPPSAVWPYLFQEDKLKQWVTWLVEAKPSEEPSVGRHGKWVMRDENNGGQLMTIDSVVTTAEPAKRLEVDLSVPGMFSGKGRYTLTELPNGGTRLETNQQYDIDNWFARLMMPVISRAAGKKAASDLARLKQAAEKQP